MYNFNLIFWNGSIFRALFETFNSLYRLKNDMHIIECQYHESANWKHSHADTFSMALNKYCCMFRS